MSMYYSNLLLNCWYLLASVNIVIIHAASSASCLLLLSLLSPAPQPPVCCSSAFCLLLLSLLFLSHILISLLSPAPQCHLNLFILFDCSLCLKIPSTSSDKTVLPVIYHNIYQLYICPCRSVFLCICVSQIFGLTFSPFLNK